MNAAERNRLIERREWRQRILYPAINGASVGALLVLFLIWMFT